MITLGLMRLGFTPDVDFIAQNDGDVTYIKEWLSSESIPSDAIISKAIKEWQTEYDNNQYARDRKARYDALNQFEMQYDDAVNGTTTWVDAINDIKARFPK